MRISVVPWRLWALGAAVLLMVVLLVLVGLRLVAASATASSAADAYNRSAARVTSAPAEPIVTVIGDDLSTSAQLGTPTEPWTRVAASALHEQLISLSSAGAGYTARSSSTSFGGTFVARASQVSPQSEAVVFLGGANDVQVSVADLRHSVDRALQAARSSAPNAVLVVVGPVSTAGSVPSALLQVRDVLQTEAGLAKAVFVDPIEQHWLTGKGLVRDDGSTLTQAGQDVLASRMEIVLKLVCAQAGDASCGSQS